MTRDRQTEYVYVFKYRFRRTATLRRWSRVVCLRRRWRLVDSPFPGQPALGSDTGHSPGTHSPALDAASEPESRVSTRPGCGPALQPYTRAGCRIALFSGNAINQLQFAYRASLTCTTYRLPSCAVSQSKSNWYSSPVVGPESCQRARAESAFSHSSERCASPRRSQTPASRWARPGPGPSSWSNVLFDVASLNMY